MLLPEALAYSSFHQRFLFDDTPLSFLIGFVESNENKHTNTHKYRQLHSDAEVLGGAYGQQRGVGSL